MLFYNASFLFSMYWKPANITLPEVFLYSKCNTDGTCCHTSLAWPKAYDVMFPLFLHTCQYALLAQVQFLSALLPVFVWASQPAVSVLFIFLSPCQCFQMAYK